MSFIGEPALSISIEPTFGVSKVNLKKIPYLENVIRNLIFSGIETCTYPNKSTMKLPMTFRSKKNVYIPRTNNY